MGPFRKDGAGRMERLWSPAGATSGNRWQMPTPRKRDKQAKTVAVGCDQLPPNLDGKEGVDGSSPSEGFTKGQQMAFLLPRCERIVPGARPLPVPKTYSQATDDACTAGD